MTARPYFNATGDELVALIEAGNAKAIAEGKFRSNRKVQAALAARKTTAKAPAPKATPKARPTGAGSRGGDPVKARRAALADSTGFARGTQGWWSAYKATKTLNLQAV